MEITGQRVKKHTFAISSASPSDIRFDFRFLSFLLLFAVSILSEKETLSFAILRLKFGKYRVKGIIRQSGYKLGRCKKNALRSRPVDPISKSVKLRQRTG